MSLTDEIEVREQGDESAVISIPISVLVWGDRKLDEIIPVVMEETGYDGEWFAIDLCFWPEAWEVTENAKKFLTPYLEKY